LRLRGVDWGRSGQIYYQSNNKEISSIAIDSLKEKIIAQFSFQTYLPFIIDEVSMGILKGLFRVVDINSYSLKDSIESTIISSSFNDYFAAGGSDFIAFVSNRSGDPQIWLKDDAGNSKQVTHFEKSFEINWLSISQKEDLIMFGKSGHINIIDRNGKVIFDSENYNNQVYKNPVFDEKNGRFIYSTQFEGEWNIETRKIYGAGQKDILFEGVTAKPCQKANCLYYIKDNDSYLYKYDPVNNTSVKIKSIGKLTKSSEWELLSENVIIYLERDKDMNKLIRLNLITDQKTILFESKAKRFSLDRKRNKIYTDLKVPGNIDLMLFNL